MTISGLASAGGPPLDRSGELLAAGRASRQREQAEQAMQLQIAVEYAALNPPAPDRPAAALPGTEGALLLAGEGAPAVAEFAVVELAAAWGMFTDAGRTFLGQALEIHYRLPHTRRQVAAGELPAWRARRIAEHTLHLPADGAAWVDEQVAPVAGHVGPTVLQRLVEEALVRFDPETAAQLALEALQTRHATITIDHTLDAALSTGRLEAILDLADALDLDTALADLAADLAQAGDTDPLDLRRAKALGLLARGQRVDLPDHLEPRCRHLVLHIHLAEAALRGAGDGIADLHSHTGHPFGQVTVEQVQQWCADPNAQVSVKPVLDLGQTLSCTGYRPSPRLRDQVIALNPTCVFPHCHRPADNLDLDHILEHARGGNTTTDNLVPLCRRHHRAKTFDHWTYIRLGPAEYLWTSPHHYQWIRDPDGTRDVTTDLKDTG